jgi:epsilon-lactone hydrolase
MPSAEHEQFITDRLANIPAVGTLEDARADFEQLMAKYPPAADTVIEAITIDGIAADWISAGKLEPHRMLLYLHGGAYALGSHVAYRGFGSRVASACRARVLVPDYRLTPEHPFPAALEDALRVYEWLSAQVAPERILLAGDSAGGGLAISTLAALRDSGRPLPRCAVLYSPWTDLACTGDSHQLGAVDDPFFTAEGVRALGRMYAGDRVSDPRASPLHADLAGLPPMQVFAGSREILLDDATRLVEKARGAGVEARIVVGNGLIHAWPVYDLPESRTSLEQSGKFVEEIFGCFSRA